MRSQHRRECTDIGVEALDEEEVVVDGNVSVDGKKIRKFVKIAIKIHSPQRCPRAIRELQVNVQQPLLILRGELPGDRGLGDISVIHVAIGRDGELEAGNDTHDETRDADFIASDRILLGSDHATVDGREDLNVGAAHHATLEGAAAERRDFRVGDAQQRLNQISDSQAGAAGNQKAHSAGILS